MMTLGSLFDGIGVWQLAAERIGILPVWSSEIEKFPREVTARHFPNSIQLGDINKITDAPKVDIITAGSPCQDISIAGKQGGIHRERSGLFFKAVELVRRIRPEFFVWENVPNVLHIHGGADFRACLKKSAKPKFQYLNTDSVTRDWLTAEEVKLRGTCLTLNIGEQPNDVKECFLSQILQDDVPDKYSLSPRACEGILRRARRHKTKLPPELLSALAEIQHPQ